MPLFLSYLHALYSRSQDKGFPQLEVFPIRPGKKESVHVSKSGSNYPQICPVKVGLGLKSCKTPRITEIKEKVSIRSSTWCPRATLLQPNSTPLRAGHPVVNLHTGHRVRLLAYVKNYFSNLCGFNVVGNAFLITKFFYG